MANLLYNTMMRVMHSDDYGNLDSLETARLLLDEETALANRASPAAQFSAASSIHRSSASEMVIDPTSSSSADQFSAAASVPDSSPSTALDHVEGAPGIPTRLTRFMLGRSISSTGRATSASAGDVRTTPDGPIGEFCMLPADEELERARHEIMAGVSPGLGCELCKFPPALANTSPQLKQFHDAASAFSSDVTDVEACEELATLFNRLIYQTDLAADGVDGVRKVTAGDVMVHREHSLHLHTGDIHVYNDLIQALHESIKHVRQHYMYIKKPDGSIVLHGEGSKNFFKLISAYRQMAESRQKRISLGVCNGSDGDSSSSSGSGKSGKRARIRGGGKDGGRLDGVQFIAELGI